MPRRCFRLRLHRLRVPVGVSVSQLEPINPNLLKREYYKISVHFHNPSQTVRGSEGKAGAEWRDEALGCGYLADKLCIKTAQVARNRLFSGKGRSRPAGEFITGTEGKARRRGRRTEKEILPSFISQPTDVLPSQRQQAGDGATQPRLTRLI